MGPHSIPMSRTMQQRPAGLGGNPASNQGSNVRLGSKHPFIQIGDGLKLTGPSTKAISTTNGGIMHAKGTAELPLNRLKVSARQALIALGLKAKALMSMSKLADAGYTTIFHPHDKGVTTHDNNDFKVIVNSPLLLQGWRQVGGLWTVPLVQGAQVSPALDIIEQANNVYDLPCTREVVRFLHAALGFSTKTTLMAAIRRGNLVTFPGMTTKNVARFFRGSEETQKGYMRQTCQGVGLTKPRDVDECWAEATTIKLGEQKRDVYIQVFDATKQSMYTDQTGRFPITSAKGNK